MNRLAYKEIVALDGKQICYERLSAEVFRLRELIVAAAKGLPAEDDEGPYDEGAVIALKEEAEAIHREQRA